MYQITIKVPAQTIFILYVTLAITVIFFIGVWRSTGRK